MASADVTTGNIGGEFSYDGTARTLTLRVPGMWIRNTHNSEILTINVEGGTPTAAQGLGAGSYSLRAGQEVKLPPSVTSVKFIGTGAGYFIVFNK